MAPRRILVKDDFEVWCEQIAPDKFGRDKWRVFVKRLTNKEIRTAVVAGNWPAIYKGAMDLAHGLGLSSADALDEPRIAEKKEER